MLIIEKTFNAGMSSSIYSILRVLDKILPGLLKRSALHGHYFLSGNALESALRRNGFRILLKGKLTYIPMSPIPVQSLPWALYSLITTMFNRLENAIEGTFLADVLGIESVYICSRN